MRLNFSHQRQRGIALIIVMIVIVVFAVLAGGLSYSMKVETKLARNASWDTELEWIGRSGVEMAKYLLSQTGQGGMQYEALNQKWAGGTGETNAALAEISLTDNHLGHGRFSIKIEDAERKFNINLAAQAPEVMNQAMILMGIEATDAPRLVATIRDWIDRDDHVTAGATESESSYYLSLKPPYPAKNGPIDDLTELMLINGITPPMFYGSGGGGPQRFAGMRTMNSGGSRPGEEQMYPIGFKDLFNTIGLARVNVNTASATVFQLIPEVDDNLAQAIIRTRAGPDGVEGDEDDMPFRSIGELANVPGMPHQAIPLFQKYFGTRSATFEVTVEAEIDQYKRTYYALVRKLNQNQIVTLYMYWR